MTKGKFFFVVASIVVDVVSSGWVDWVSITLIL